MRIDNWIITPATKKAIKTRVDFCVEILEYISKKNTTFSKLGQFIVTTFKNIAYIDFTKIQFFKKPDAFESKKMTELLTEKFSSIPYFDLIEALCDELEIMYGRRASIVDEFNEQLGEKHRMIKKLLLVKEHFERKEEVGALEHEIQVLNIEIARLKSTVKSEKIEIFRTKF